MNGREFIAAGTATVPRAAAFERPQIVSLMADQSREGAPGVSGNTLAQNDAGGLFDGQSAWVRKHL